MELLARHASDPVPSLRAARPSIPEPLEAVVYTALAKQPAERFASAQQLAQALAIDATAYRRRQWVRKLVRRTAIAAAGTIVVAVAAYGVTRYRSASDWKRQPLDANTVAILPFRVTATDSTLASLDVGLMDLLWAVLPGDVGPRAVDVGSLLRRWQDMQLRGSADAEDAPLRLAASFGAGLLLEGSAVQTGAQLTVNALLRRVPDGGEVARYTLPGTLDSLPVLPTRLVMGLLGTQLGEDAARLHRLNTEDPEAVKAYIAGATAYQAGRYEEGMRHFSRALEIDSTFAEAALRLIEIDVYPSVTQYDLDRREQQAVALRARLSRRDQLELGSLVYDSNVNDAEWLATVAAWTRAAPENQWAWLQYAAALGYARPALGRAGWMEEARRALAQSWTVDSTTAGIVGMHVHEAVQLGYIEWLRRVAPWYLDVADTTDPSWPPYRWVIAIVTGDSATVRDLRQAVRDGTRPEFGSAWVGHRLMWVCLEALVGCSDARMVTDLAMSRLATRADSTWAFIAGYILAAHQGRMHQFAELWDPWRKASLQISQVPPGAAINPTRASNILGYAMNYRGLDSVAAVVLDSLDIFWDRGQWEGIWAPAEAARLAASGVAYDTAGMARARVSMRCQSEEYRARIGDTAGVLARALGVDREARTLGGTGMCSTVVEAIIESHDHERAEKPALERLDTLNSRTAYWDGRVPEVFLARLHREAGDYARALTLAQSRPRTARYNLGTHFRLAFLYEEGRAAELLGDTATAPITTT
jgi:tetratricopeptide (TPR) repeat protein